jgi:hypothetical protein
MSGPAFLNPAGGLRYHLRALRYSQKLWQPFRWALGEWLLEWQPPETTLLLVGPSGGYNLQPFLFERFQRVVCLEPDPLARALFARRLAKAPLDARPKLEFVSEDHLLQQPERLLELLEGLGSACVLFSNVLGQLRALLEVASSDAPELVRVRDGVHAALVGRSWASFHDRVSGFARPTFDGVVLTEARLSDEEVVASAYENSISATQLANTELLDHLTEGFFPENLPHAYFVWELGPGLFHLIEGVCSVSANSRKSE